jgi:hypothetical protein
MEDYMTLNVHPNILRDPAFYGRGPANPAGRHGRGFVPGMRPREGISVNGGSGDDEILVNLGNSQPGSEEPVAANEHGRIWNDPRFQGGDGGRFDVQGEAGKSYNLLSDSGLQLNGRFDEFNGNGTAVGETGLTVTGEDGSTSEISFKKDGTALINGEQMEQGKRIALADGGTAKLEGNKLTVTTAEGYTIEQQARTWGDGFINIDVTTGDNGVGNGQLPGGLLGQTFDADDAARNGRTGHGAQGEGAIDGVVQDYETEGLFAPESGESAGAAGPIDIDGGSGDDRIEVNGPFNGPVHVNGGSGDDVIIINTGPPPPGPDPNPPAERPVAANETGKIWGDPHFVGGDGGKYDVQGEAGKIYDLLSDSELEFRGQFDGWGDGVTVVGETGLTVGSGLNSDNINFRKDGTARINGQLMEEGETYDLADGGTARLENGELTITTAEGYTIKQTAQGSGDRAYINIEVTTGENGVGNGQMPGGLLGQTFDADNEARNGKTGHGAQGEGAITGDVSDYERPALDPINDNRGSTDGAEETGDGFEQLMQKLQDLFNQLMDLLNQLNGDVPEPAPLPKPETHTDAGSGDDKVEITAGGHHTVDLGSGDDEAYVDFGDGDGGNSATINGGSGSDAVTLAGSASDYEVSYRDGYTIYTDQDGNTIRVADDVEQVRFEEAQAA